MCEKVRDSSKTTNGEGGVTDKNIHGKKREGSTKTTPPIKVLPLEDYEFYELPPEANEFVDVD